MEKFVGFSIKFVLSRSSYFPNLEKTRNARQRLAVMAAEPANLEDRTAM